MEPKLLAKTGVATIKAAPTASDNARDRLRRLGLPPRLIGGVCPPNCGACQEQTLERDCSLIAAQRFSVIWWTAIKALGSPASGEDAWSGLIAAIDKHAANAREQADAAARGNTATFTKDNEVEAKAQVELLDAANRAGIPDCAKLDR